MVERFNRRISEALRAKENIRDNHGRNKFHDYDERSRYIYQFVENYNKTRLKCLQYQSPNKVLSKQAGLYTEERG